MGGLWGMNHWRRLQSPHSQGINYRLKFKVAVQFFIASASSTFIVAIYNVRIASLVPDSQKGFFFVGLRSIGYRLYWLCFDSIPFGACKSEEEKQNRQTV